MKTIQPRIKAAPITNRIDFEGTVDRISYAQTELRLYEADRDSRVQSAQFTHADLITALEAEIKAKSAFCAKFAKEHRAELLPGKAKRAETPLSRYGFRTGMPTLKLLSKWTWEKVIDKLQLRLGDDYVRTKIEADKAKIIADATDKGKLGKSTSLDIVGLKIKQAESFYIEPKVDGAEHIKGDKA